MPTRPRLLSTLDRHRPLVALVAMLVLLLVGYLVVGAGGSSGAGSPTSTTQGVVADATAPGTVAESALPSQAKQTLALIRAGGPYPFAEDDTVFANREGLLPTEVSGFYREYTVRTPGESDRGPRRIVAGADGTKWYTDDHYSSFRRIVERT